MAARRNGRQQPLPVKLVEGGVGIGAATGLLIAASHAAHHGASRPCPTGHSAGAASKCLAAATTNAVLPYVKGGIIGGIVGAVIALLAVLLWQLASRPVALAFAGGGPRSAPVRPGREPIHECVRHEVWRRDEGCCVDCGSRERLEFDHIIPVSRGGSNTARNLELRCESCNRRKSDRI